MSEQNGDDASPVGPTKPGTKPPQRESEAATEPMRFVDSVPLPPVAALTEYTTDVRLWEIEDGESHTYAAESAWEALRVHIGDMDAESDYFTIRMRPAREVVRFHVDQTDDESRAEFGDAATGYALAGANYVVSTAATFAQHYAPIVATRDAVQVCSSVY